MYQLKIVNRKLKLATLCVYLELLVCFILAFLVMHHTKEQR